jgi:hypothetical protein
MNIRIVKLDLTETNKQLERIADLLEGILGATDPIPAHWTDFPEDKEKERVMYSSDRDEIIAAAVERIKRYR